MSRTKKLNRHLSVRLADDVAKAVGEMAKSADWSESKVLNHLAKVGLAYGEGRYDDARALSALWGLAAFEREVHVEAAAKIKAARAGDRPDPDQMLIQGAVDQAAAVASLAADAAPPGEPPADAPARRAKRQKPAKSKKSR